MLINEENFHEIIHRSFPCFRTPTGLEDVSKYPELFAELLARGWSERDIQKLAGLNLIRVFKAVEKVNFFFQDRVVKRKEKKREDKRFLPLSWREKKNLTPFSSFSLWIYCFFLSLSLFFITTMTAERRTHFCWCHRPGLTDIILGLNYTAIKTWWSGCGLAEAGKWLEKSKRTGIMVNERLDRLIYSFFSLRSA